ncbi:MAG: hypothetical protein WC248_05395 [Candidatus Methanomethylophilaceae archaeon]|jgi:hypothetical protein
MEKTTSSEFIEWMAFLDLERNQTSKEDYYLAQVAAEVRRSFVKSPQSVHVKDFILSFTRAERSSLGGGSPAMEDPSQRSKNYWSAVLGLEKKE